VGRDRRDRRCGRVAHWLDPRHVEEIQEVSMGAVTDSDRSNRIVLAVIAILGAVLCLIGWYRYLT
jgi:hypothetical protein